MINTLNEINKRAKNVPQNFIKECNDEYLNNIISSIITGIIIEIKYV